MYVYSYLCMQCRLSLILYCYNSITQQYTSNFTCANICTYLYDVYVDIGAYVNSMCTMVYGQYVSLIDVSNGVQASGIK